MGDAAKAIDTAHLEGAALDRVVEEAVEPLERLMREAQIALGQASPETDDGATMERLIALDRAVLGGDPSAVASAAASLVGALCPRPVATSDVWALLEACEIRRRALLKCGRALARGGPAEYPSELSFALRARKLASAFRRVVDSDRPPTDRERAARLMRIGSSLAVLVGKPGYVGFDVALRRSVRSLQRDLVQWSRTRTDDAPRLYERSVELTRALGAVGLRADVIEHDAGIVAALRGPLGEARDAGRSVGASELELLAGLAGASDTLDAMRSERESDPASILSVLQLLARRRVPGAR